MLSVYCKIAGGALLVMWRVYNRCSSGALFQLRALSAEGDVSAPIPCRAKAGANGCG